MTGRVIPRNIEFQAVFDDPIGIALTPLFQEYWPAYRRWMKRSQSTTSDHSSTQLKRYMPELIPVFDQLVEQFGGTSPVAQFLALYNPPKLVRGCSQIVIDSDDGPVLVRSYDHHPLLIDAIVLKSRWLDRKIVAMTDCIWGVLDGINEDGLAISLAFGGRDEVGPGFAAPLVARYILETCANVKEAKSVLARVPVYMPYTFLVVDAQGDFVTAHTGPDIPTRFIERRSSTNHQSINDWPAYCQFTQSAERLELLESLPDTTQSIARVIDSFLRPPLWRNDYARASGTLYVAEYRPAELGFNLHWLTQHESFSINEFEPRRFQVPLHDPTSFTGHSQVRT